MLPEPARTVNSLSTAFYQGCLIYRVCTRPGASGRFEFEPSERVGAPETLSRGAGCSVRGPLGAQERRLPERQLQQMPGWSIIRS